jgi:hypothetical protein
VNDCVRTFGFEKSSLIECSKLNKAEPVILKPSMNWIVRLLSLPNTSIENRDDVTNIQANKQMKIVKSIFELICVVKVGLETPNEKVATVRACLNKDFVTNH